MPRDERGRRAASAARRRRRPQPRRLARRPARPRGVAGSRVVGIAACAPLTRSSARVVRSGAPPVSEGLGGRATAPSGPSTTASAAAWTSAGVSPVRTAIPTVRTPSARSWPSASKPGRSPTSSPRKHTASRPSASSSSAVPLSTRIGGCSSTDIFAGRTSSPVRAACRSAQACTSAADLGPGAVVDGQREALRLDERPRRCRRPAGRDDVGDHLAPGPAVGWSVAAPLRDPLEAVEPRDDDDGGSSAVEEVGGAARQDGDEGVAVGEGSERVDGAGERPGGGRVVDDGGQRAVEVAQHASGRRVGAQRFEQGGEIFESRSPGRYFAAVPKGWSAATQTSEVTATSTTSPTRLRRADGRHRRPVPARARAARGRRRRSLRGDVDGRGPLDGHPGGVKSGPSITTTSTWPAGTFCGGVAGIGCGAAVMPTAAPTAAASASKPGV